MSEDGKNTRKRKPRKAKVASRRSPSTRGTPRNAVILSPDHIGTKNPRSVARLKNPTSTVGHPRKAVILSAAKNPRKAVILSAAKNPRSAQDPVSPLSRLRFAIRKAREMQRVLQAGDEDVLIQSTLMQGLLSGDVMAASIRARLKLQRENQAMRRRLTMSRIRTESVKQKLLQHEVDARSRPQRPWIETVNEIRQIWGLPPVNPPLLPEAQNITAEVVSEPL